MEVLSTCFVYSTKRYLWYYKFLAVSNREEKSLRHVVMKAKFLDVNKPWSCKYQCRIPPPPLIFRPNWGSQTQSLTEPQNVFLHNKVGAFYDSQRKNAFRSQAFRTILRPFSNDSIYYVTSDNSRDKFSRTGLKAGTAEFSGLYC